MRKPIRILTLVNSIKLSEKGWAAAAALFVTAPKSKAGQRGTAYFTPNKDIAITPQ